MYIVKINNIVNNNKYSSTFETQEEANQWIDKQVNKESWGRNQRIIYNDSETYNSDLIISQVYGVDEDGNPTSEITLKAEYEYTIEEIDITSNTKEAKDERLRIATESAALYKKMNEFGQLVKLYFTGLINARIITAEQKDIIQQDANIKSISVELDFGRISKAKNMITDLIQTDEYIYYQEDIDKVTQLMDDFITGL